MNKKKYPKYKNNFYKPIRKKQIKWENSIFKNRKRETRMANKQKVAQLYWSLDICKLQP